MHLRMPSLPHGVVSFLWAAGLGLFVYFGLVAVGISGPTAVLIAAVAAGVIFLYVRTYGEDRVRRPPR